MIHYVRSVRPCYEKIMTHYWVFFWCIEEMAVIQSDMLPLRLNSNIFRLIRDLHQQYPCRVCASCQGLSSPSSPSSLSKLWWSYLSITSWFLLKETPVHPPALSLFLNCHLSFSSSISMRSTLDPGGREEEEEEEEEWKKTMCLINWGITLAFSTYCLSHLIWPFILNLE